MMLKISMLNILRHPLLIYDLEKFVYRINVSYFLSIPWSKLLDSQISQRF